MQALNLNQLMQKEMTRKQFLVTIGIAIIAIFGFGNILKLLGKDLSNHSLVEPAGAISPSYGGSKKSGRSN